jgi:hypothetical protein
MLFCANRFFILYSFVNLSTIVLFVCGCWWGCLQQSDTIIHIKWQWQLVLILQDWFVAIDHPLYYPVLSNFYLGNLTSFLFRYVHELSTTDISQDCVLGSLCYIRTVFHLNCLTAQLSYEGRAAVEGAEYYFISKFDHHNINGGAVDATWRHR